MRRFGGETVLEEEKENVEAIGNERVKLWGRSCWRMNSDAENGDWGLDEILNEMWTVSGRLMNYGDIDEGI